MQPEMCGEIAELKSCLKQIHAVQVLMLENGNWLDQRTRFRDRQENLAATTERALQVANHLERKLTAVQEVLGGAQDVAGQCNQNTASHEPDEARDYCRPQFPRPQ